MLQTLSSIIASSMDPLWVDYLILIDLHCALFRHPLEYLFAHVHFQDIVLPPFTNGCNVLTLTLFTNLRLTLFGSLYVSQNIVTWNLMRFVSIFSITISNFYTFIITDITG